MKVLPGPPLPGGKRPLGAPLPPRGLPLPLIIGPPRPGPPGPPLNENK